MIVVILCGGRGTRLMEETDVRPKPMVEIGGKPILWHIMNIYGASGFKEFALALGYKGDVIKLYFHNYHLLNSDLSVSLQTGEVLSSPNSVNDWKVHLVDTGPQTMTGGRVRRLRERLTNTFMMTYGDGVADVDLNKLVAFHRSHGKIATLTAVRPPARFGEIRFDGDRVSAFQEKPQATEGWINGGFFVLEPPVFDYIRDDATILEREPLEQLAKDGELMAYRHEGFWHSMDTLRDKRVLETLWQHDRAPWKVWKDQGA